MRDWFSRIDSPAWASKSESMLCVSWVDVGHLSAGQRLLIFVMKLANKGFYQLLAVT
jgi:hypothetical protein